MSAAPAPALLALGLATAEDLSQVTLPLSEVFGPTWQGEGPHAGRRCAFIRLGLCNLTCEWCDTPFTWDSSRYDVHAECPETPVVDIWKRLEATGCSMVVLSGGEPLVHHQRLPHLFTHHHEWHVETNGTIAPPEYWDRYVTHTTVSPKVNTRDPLKKRFKPAALRAWADKAARGRAAFKFVVTNPRDLDVIEAIMRRYDIPRRRVWVMPEGTTAEAVIAHHRDLAPHIEAHGFNTTTRLHTLLYDNERGR